MPEYIEREALIKAINKSLYNNPHENGLVARTHKQEHLHFLSMTVAQPTADVVEVVRCKDCKNRNTLGCPMLHYVDGELIGHTADDDYCSDGERKE